MARIKYFLFAIIISSIVSTSIQCKYDKCPDPWNYGSFVDHTMCLYSETSFGPKCDVVKSSSLDGNEKEVILNRHNELRAQVAAGKETRGKNGGQPAGIIGPLEWDDELATIAQRWANQCLFEHDKCRDIGKIGVGQNLGYQATFGQFNNKFVDIVSSWYDEVEDFDHNLVSNYQSQRGAVTTHYTQLIWASTTRVGCGGVRHITNDGYHRVHLVCDYSPKGNWIGEAVYKLGVQPAENPRDDSDLEMPLEPADQPENESDIGISITAPVELVNDKPIAKIPRNEQGLVSHNQSYTSYAVHIHKSPFTDDYVRDTRSHPVEQPNIYGPDTNVHMQQGCKYAGCEDSRIPGLYTEHTMCRYPNMNLGELCTHVQQSNLNSIEENAILSVHNDLRKEQRSGNIRPLQWNTELAEIAQRWASQCQYAHDECRNVRGLEVGQNVGKMSHTDRVLQFTDIVEAWYYGLDNYAADYTHLTWANATDVGCGGVKYKDANGKFETYLVCNYLSQRNINRLPDQSIDQFHNSAPSLINARIQPVYKECEDSWTRGKYHTHTMWRYPHLMVAAECNKVIQSSLKPEEKQQIIDILNEVRRRTDYNIRGVRWNDQLAVVAQRWANQCRAGNDECRDLDDMSHVGQNFGMVGGKKTFLYEFSDIVNSWINGVAPRHSQPGSNYGSNLDEGLSAQLVSAITTEIGCGGIKYIDTQEYHNTYLVCNYQPSGNHHVRFFNDINISFGTQHWLP